MSRFKVLAISAAVLLAILAAPLLFVPKPVPGPGPAPGPRPSPAITHGLPWQIEFPAPGASRVFGLTLGGPAPSTLADARRAFPGESTLALLAPTDQPLALEAYFDSVSAGPLLGKLVLNLSVSPGDLDAMRDRAAKTDHLETGIRKFTLSEADQLRADALPLAGIVFVPSARLDDAVILQRFGAPAERIRQGETLEHFLYPAKGLDVVLDAKGKEILQYVAPVDFDRLRAPLVK